MNRRSVILAHAGVKENGYTRGDTGINRSLRTPDGLCGHWGVLSEKRTLCARGGKAMRETVVGPSRQMTSSTTAFRKEPKVVFHSKVKNILLIGQIWRSVFLRRAPGGREHADC